MFSKIQLCILVDTRDSEIAIATSYRLDKWTLASLVLSKKHDFRVTHLQRGSFSDEDGMAVMFVYVKRRELRQSV